MLCFRPLYDNTPILGESIQIEIVGEGRGILTGPAWLKRHEDEHKLSAKRFGKVAISRKTPVSTSRPDLPALSRRPRLVKAGQIVWINLSKPANEVRLFSFKSRKTFIATINPKGVIAKAPRIMANAGGIKVNHQVRTNNYSPDLSLVYPRVNPLILKTEVVPVTYDKLYRLQLLNTEFDENQNKKLSQTNK
jgi:hypothetical protein